MSLFVYNPNFVWTQGEKETEAKFALHIPITYGLISKGKNYMIPINEGQNKQQKNNFWGDFLDLLLF